MTDHPPGFLDITEGDPRRPLDAPRPSIQVWFRCSNQYIRVIRSPDGAIYAARCPACARCIQFRTGPGGTSQRFFEVNCRG